MAPHLDSPSQPSRRFVEANHFENDLFLMVDERLVSQADGARWEFCPLEKRAEPVLLPTPRCEGGTGTEPLPVHGDPFVGSVLWDAQQEHYVAWYRSNRHDLPPTNYPIRSRGVIIPNREREGSNFYMAHSRDGIAWERPNLGAVRCDGSYANNLISNTPGPVLMEHASGVLPNYLGDGKGDLVATVYSKFDDAIYPHGITHMHSADGVAWEPHYPPPLPLDGDAHCLMWNPREQCYLCTTRSAPHSNIVTRLQARGFPDVRRKRHVALAKSRDLVHWTPMLDILEADENDPASTELYSMYILPYGNLYLGFVEMFHVAPGMHHGPLEMQLALSYDLKKWHRAGARQPLLPRGGHGAWDDSHVRLFASSPFVEGNRLRFWYGGKNAEHWQTGTAGIGTATLRRDGFGCWQAGPEGGVVTTVPLRVEWSTRIMLNVDAGDRGEARVEVLDESGTPLEGCAFEDCQPITGDQYRGQVIYRAPRGTFVRHTGNIRLRFHLRDCRLYAFRAFNVFLPEKGGAIENQWM